MLDNKNCPEKEEKVVYNPQAVVHALAIETLRTIISDKINELKDETATQVLTKLNEFADLIKKADKYYYEVLDLIVEDELAIINHLGYSYMKNSDGSLEFYSAEDVRHSRDEPVKTPLTKDSYHAVLDHMYEDFHKNGIPSKYKVAYSHLKETYKELLNYDEKFNMVMEQARPYLSNVEGLFLITQFYTNIQLLQSIINMFEHI